MHWRFVISMPRAQVTEVPLPLNITGPNGTITYITLSRREHNRQAGAT